MSEAAPEQTGIAPAPAVGGNPNPDYQRAYEILSAAITAVGWMIPDLQRATAEAQRILK